MATLILVIPVGASLLIAADGKRTNAVDNTEELTGCKIGVYPGFAFAAAGFTEGGGYSAHAIARAAAKGAGTLSEKVALIEERILAELPEAVKKLEEATKAPFPMTTISTVVVAGAEDGGVHRYERRFKRGEGGSIEIELSRHFQNGQGSLGPGSTFGNAAADVADFSARISQGAIQANGPIDHARMVIEEGIRVRPDVVGLPISMVRVVSDGIHWIAGYRPAACPELIDP